MARRLFVLVAAVAAIASGLTSALTSPARAAVVRGFTDFDAFTSPSAADDALALARAKAAGATVIRFQLSWGAVATRRPPSLAVAADPAWAGYDWRATDQTIERIAAAGLSALPFVSVAPAWAEGPHRPAVSDRVPTGTWNPSAAAFGAFATALARRYSGAFLDPLAPGRTLPAVRRWQAWNEPNLYTNLTPQYVRSHGRTQPASPRIFRNLLNAFYKGVKTVGPGDEVITGGTAPFGGLTPSDPRIPPARFWRLLLCVDGRAHPRARRCPVTHFDAIAHHPYPINGPTAHAINPDDVVVPDLARITRPLKAAIRHGSVRPSGPKPLWVTELSWDSSPDPDAISESLQARYLSGSFDLLVREGVAAIVWFQLRDQAKGPGWDQTYQSGIFRRGASVAADQPKLSATAFRFPFSAYRSRGTARLWGIAPVAGSVQIQRAAGASWTTVKTLATLGASFRGRLRIGPGVTLRAVVGAEISAPWTTS